MGDGGVARRRGEIPRATLREGSAPFGADGMGGRVSKSRTPDKTGTPERMTESVDWPLALQHG